MRLELIVPYRVVGTVSANMNMNMPLQFFARLKQLSAVGTVIRSSVAVYATFMLLQAAGLAESFVAQRTFVRPFSGVGSQVTFQMSHLNERLVAHIAPVRLLSRVHSHVSC